MQIVINISKHIYEHAKEQSEDSNDEWDAMRAIANGTPLPKGYGRLIDADALLAAFEKDISEQTKHMELMKSVGNMKSYFDISNVQTGMVSCRRVLENAPTIIEADKAESENKR